MRRSEIYLYDKLAGHLTEDERGYHFQYLIDYQGEPVSLTMPVRQEPYISKMLHPFFDGLIPEGWLLEIAEKNWKLNPRDRMGLLLACCRDTIGAVSVLEIPS